MTYPDGEVVTYHYNVAGQIVRLSGNKQGRESVIVDRIGYDKDGHTVYTKLGNGTETTYTYDKQRERLQAMNLTADGRAVMENKYQYDAVDNILGIANAVDPTQAASGNSGKAKLGGAFNHTYAYDELNRLIRANGEAKGAKYEMTMTFGRMSEPLTKVQKVDSTKTAQSYDFTYQYEDSNHPTAPTQIGHEHYTYDANGNPTLVENDSLNSERRMYWDEDNRLMVLSDNGKTSRYTYNAAGERIVKSHGDLEGVYVNGAPQGMTFHETEDYTIYPAPIITVTKNRFTKHYFIGDKRIASKLGTGKFSNVYGISSNNVTAGQKDYAARMLQIEKQREDYYRKLGTPPGVPTMKGATADPDNTGYGYNTIIGELGDHSVPEGWVQRPKFNDKGDVPGPPIQWQKPEDPDNAQPGYGYVPADTAHHEEIFFYHSDHLGSTSYITDAKANITQFDAYLPYGELLVDEHSSSEEMPYKFNGKEFDQETGLYYYGARYMNPVTSLWYGVDALKEKYPSLGGYVYCIGNPTKFIDPDGNIPIETIWDAANVALGAVSLVNNIQQGNVGGAIVDGVGIIIDATATVLPYIPGGASSVIKSYRAGKNVTKTTQAAIKTTKAVTNSSTSISKTTGKSRRAAFRQAKRDARIPTSQNFKTHKQVDAAKNKNSGRKGIEYEFDSKGAYGSEYSKFVQDHYQGHNYMDGTIDNTPHFNIHQRKGSPRITNENNHYPYIPKKKK